METDTPPPTTVILQVDPKQTGENMSASTTGSIADVSDDFATLSMEQAMDTHAALMTEARGNASSVHLIRDQGANRRFMQDNPITAASVAKILS